MSDAVFFFPIVAGPIQFQGKGSRIVNPDVQPVFWGPHWPASVGPVSAQTIMQAIRTLASSPFFDGLKQYGFVGPVVIRDPIIDPRVPDIVLPVPATTSNQPLAVSAKVTAYVKTLVSDDRIGNVDDNHELITMVFVDPSIPLPVGASGANTWVDDYNFLDDATRYEICWVSCAQDLAGITSNFSHELVEAIADPFGNGWEQITPQPGPNLGQIGDVCGSTAQVNGVTVSAYFSQSDGKCVVPLSGTRAVLSLTYTPDAHEPHRGPLQHIFVDLGQPLCAAGVFDATEITYRNAVTARLVIQGYESPVIEWRINGKLLSILGGTVTVPSTTDVPGGHPVAATADIQTFRGGRASTEITLSVGPGSGNTAFRLDVNVYEDFDPPVAGASQQTLRRGLIEFDLLNQEIEWGADFVAASKNCNRLKHLSAGPGIVIGPPRPGDPAGLAALVERAMRTSGAEREVVVQRAADALRPARPQLAQAMADLAARLKLPS
jgi:hypothetical protein